MVRTNTTGNDFTPRPATPQQPGRAALGCFAVAGLLIPLAMLLWSLAVRVMLGRW